MKHRGGALIAFMVLVAVRMPNSINKNKNRGAGGEIHAIKPTL